MPVDQSGGEFQMSTTQRHSPSGSRRQIVTTRPGRVTGLPSGPFEGDLVRAEQVGHGAVV
jgi:hypothetical protein